MKLWVFGLVLALFSSNLSFAKPDQFNKKGIKEFKPHKYGKVRENDYVIIPNGKLKGAWQVLDREGDWVRVQIVSRGGFRVWLGPKEYERAVKQHKGIKPGDRFPKYGDMHTVWMVGENGTVLTDFDFAEEGISYREEIQDAIVQKKDYCKGLKKLVR